MKRASILRLPSVAIVLALCFSLASAHAEDSKKKSDKNKKTTQASPTPAKTDKKKADASDSSDIVIKDPVAVVNGEKITKAELQDAFNKELQAAGVKADALSADQKVEAYNQILEAMITDRLIVAQSASIKVEQAEVDAELAKLKSQFKTEEEFNQILKRYNQTPEGVQKDIRGMLQSKKWIDSQTGGTDTVDEKEAKKFYDDNLSKFENPERVRASHILFLVPEGATPEVTKQKEEEAKKAIARLNKGEDFATVAKELSEEPGAKQSGGDLDFFTKNQMVPEFANAAFSQKVGDVGGPVKTQFGYHVIKVTDKKPAGTTPYDEVKTDLIAFLQNQKKREAVRGVIENLRKKADVKNNLPAPKQAAAPAGMPQAAPANP